MNIREIRPHAQFGVWDNKSLITRFCRVVSLLIFTRCLHFDLPYGPGARFSKGPDSFRKKAISRSSASKNGAVYTPETSCMKGTSLHL